MPLATFTPVRNDFLHEKAVGCMSAQQDRSAAHDLSNASDYLHQHAASGRPLSLVKHQTSPSTCAADVSIC